MAAERLNRIDLLERDLRQILKADPENAQALNALGYTLADRTSRHQEAYGYIQRALAQHPEDPAINDSMGWVLFRLGRHAEAEQYLKKAYEAMKDAEVSAHLGELYWVMGRKEEARKVWNDGLQLAPESPLIKTVIKRLTQ
jgi:Flp pilus assembly protein TadD